MYKHELKKYFAEAQTMPATNADGNGGSFEFGKTQGAFGIKIVVNTAMTIATTKALTIKLQDSANDSSFADFVTLFSQTASGTDMTSIPAGTVLGEEFIIPDTMNRYAKINIATTDASAAGKLDVYFYYKAR